MTSASAAIPQANPSDFVMSDADFDRIASIMYRETGIRLEEGKRSLVYARLTKRLRKYGLRAFKDYCDLIDSGNAEQERIDLISALTTHVTRFYREPHHFEFLKRTVLPPLVEAARRGQSVRMWSAGCSSGEEPYTMALSLLELEPRAGDLNIKILATDIDPITLDVGARGQYHKSLVANVAPALRDRYFRDVGNERLEATADLKSLITFRALNLNQERGWPFRGPFDIVFCRNVVIYFEEDIQTRFWHRLTPMIREGGWLFLGHSERLSDCADPFYRGEDITTYRRVAG
jgi:chemotaxis protein methyltransferase CheR